MKESIVLMTVGIAFHIGGKAGAKTYQQQCGWQVLRLEQSPRDQE